MCATYHLYDKAGKVRAGLDATDTGAARLSYAAHPRNAGGTITPGMYQAAHVRSHAAWKGTGEAVQARP